MAKKQVALKIRKDSAVNPASASPTPPPIPDLEPTIGDEPVLIVQKAYAFPSRSRCPKCGSLSTRARKTLDGVQHRACLRPSCRARKDRGAYKVPGTEI